MTGQVAIREDLRVIARNIHVAFNHDVGFIERREEKRK